MKGQDTYSSKRVFTYPGMVVEVFIPDLTDEENKIRMKRIHDAAAALLKEKKQCTTEK